MGVGGRRGGMALALFCAAACHNQQQVQGVKAAAVVDESSLDFGDVPVGERRDAEIHIRNVGYVPFNALDVLRLNGNPSFLVSLDEGKVEPGQRRPVRVQFHPLKEGALTERVKIQTDADRTTTDPVAIHGRGAPARIRISPPQLDYQTLEVDSDRTLTVTVENPIDLPLTLSLSGNNAGDFRSDTATLPAFGRVSVQLNFAPRALGSRAGQLDVRPCSDCTPTTAPLSGRSVATALVFDPAPVPFANIPVHEQTQSATRLTNISWRPIQVSRVTTSHDAFTPLTDLTARTVAAGQALQLDVQFSAQTSGPDTATLRVDYISNRVRSSDVLLDARGGRPELAITPVLIDFGDLPVGGKVGLPVRLSNTGSTGNIHFRGVRASGDAAHFSISRASRGATLYPWSGGTWPQLTAANLPIAPGNDYLETTVYFQPDAAGDFRTTIAYQSDDPLNPERTLVAMGHAYRAGPCTFRILPQSALDFGNVPPRTGAVLGFRFENAGSTICAVRDIHLSNDAGGAFFMPGGDIPGGVLYPGDAFSAQIAFRVRTAGTYRGELMITVNNPDQPYARYPILAAARDSCLVATPNFLDFGPIRFDCPPRPLRSLISNQCQTPLTVTEVQIGSGTSNQFTILNPPALPLVLNSGQGFEVQVSYSRQILGQHFSPLFVRAQSEPDRFLLPLLAETNLEGIQIERFVQGTANQLDALFIVSNTTTMRGFQERLKSAIPGWISRANERGLDLHVGVTTTGLVPRGTTCPGGARGGENGRLFPIDNSRPRIVPNTMGGAAATIQENLTVGICHNLEQGLEALRQAVTPPLIDHAKDPRTSDPDDGNLGLLRDEARFAAVVVSDEDDHSGFDPESYTQLIHALKGPLMSHRSSVSAIVPLDTSCTTAGPPGPRFQEVATQTGGRILNICAPDYGPLLDRLAVLAGGPQREFRLGETPANPSEIEVRVNGAVWDRTRWHFDDPSNSVVFETDWIPVQGQQIEVRYLAICA